jgi:hypothetical protein
MRFGTASVAHKGPSSGAAARRLPPGSSQEGTQRGSQRPNDPCLFFGLKGPTPPPTETPKHPRRESPLATLATRGYLAVLPITTASTLLLLVVLPGNSQALSSAFRVRPYRFLLSVVIHICIKQRAVPS